MNFTMKKKLEKSKRITNLHISSSILEDKQVINYFYCKVPLLFNLYENKLIHYEFLKAVFGNILENKEILRYNFQNKLFSFYNSKSNEYIFKSGALQKSQIVLGIVLVGFLIKSFPYKTLFRENKSFFKLYIKLAAKAARSPFSLNLLLFNKIIRKIKIQFYYIQKQIKALAFRLYEILFLSYLNYMKLSQHTTLTSQNYITLFTSLEILEIINLYKALNRFFVCLLFKEQILITRISTQLSPKVNLKNNKNSF